MSDNEQVVDEIAEKHRKNAEFYMSRDAESQDTPKDGPFSSSLLLENDDISVSVVRKGNIRGWQSWWFRREHKLCKKCLHSCRQSARVKILKCPQFEAKNEK